jgi:outer membrane lipopolysaccharide assembly protein LptE/RlpB
LQGQLQLAPALHRLYIQAADPYGVLVRMIKLYCKTSHVQLVDAPENATAVLEITQDTAKDEFLSVSGTQQTRQYKLSVIVSFVIKDPKGRIIVPLQTLTEERTITIQADQILGSSNEANLFYEQMRRSIAFAMMNRISSQDVTQMINTGISGAKSATTAKKNKGTT